MNAADLNTAVQLNSEALSGDAPNPKSGRTERRNKSATNVAALVAGKREVLSMRHLNQDEPHGKFTLECIERHVDRQLLRAAEKSERELLTQWAAAYGGVRS